jgi:hypothetical protein
MLQGDCSRDLAAEPTPVWTIPAHIAQLVEHFLGKEEVTGSIPVVGTTVVQRQKKMSLFVSD